jgi:putative membrane protein insertion efficiency factor
VSVRSMLVGSIRVYQRFLSPFLPAACRFYPSCSQYAIDAVDLHGPARGSWLAATRLLRCQPFCRGGFDPVPGVTEPESHRRSCRAR